MLTRVTTFTLTLGMVWYGMVTRDGLGKHSGVLETKMLTRITTNSIISILFPDRWEQ